MSREPDSGDGSRLRRTDAAEIAHYDIGARSAAGYSELRRKIAAFELRMHNAESTIDAWLDTRFDSVAQEEAVGHLLPIVAGATVLQIGGTGVASLKALIVGASQAVLVTPSQGELDLTMAVAEEFGMASRLRTICGFAEELPLEDASVQGVISEASMHHTTFITAMAEAHRVLAPGGRFACFEPWKAPFYGLGTRLLGKRDPGVHCRPMDAGRIDGLEVAFPGCQIMWHGALTRYLLIAASKFGVPVGRETVHKITRVDDRLAGVIPPMRRLGSSVSIVGDKS